MGKKPSGIEKKNKKSLLSIFKMLELNKEYYLINVLYDFSILSQDNKSYTKFIILFHKLIS